MAGSSLSPHVLGSGQHKAFLYDRGGLNRIAPINGLRLCRWDRYRDDISQATLIVDPSKCSDALKIMHTGRHEIVIYRDEERVWEGPITRRTLKAKSVEIAAHDICHYLNRTNMRNAYDNRYSTTASKVAPVTQRMEVILRNELARKETLGYNLLSYLDVRTSALTALTSRLTLPYERNVWEEMDEMAAKNGLDYTTIGRRIVLSDVHELIGRTPMLTDKDFTDEVVLTEYGMELATISAVTDGEGRYAVVGGIDPYYGETELLHTIYGERVDFADPDNPTSDELAALSEQMVGQARRNLSGRYPTPATVRVPDGTPLAPTAPVTIADLIPGVRIPVRATQLTVTVEQEQKLDRIRVEQDEDGETVSIWLSPAPGTSPWEDDIIAEQEENKDVVRA
jgi:hypothetical protein